MSKKIGNEVKIEKLGRRRAIDDYLRRPAESPEEFDARMTREKPFLEMQRALITPLIGPEKAKLVEDYYEAGLPTGFFRMLSGLPAIEHFFIEGNILQNIGERVSQFSLTTSKETGKFDNFSQELYVKYHMNYNPEVLFSSFIYPAAVTGTGINFFVLEKNKLRPGERRQIVQRADAILDVLRYAEEYYGYKDYHNPWAELLEKIEGIIAKTDPMSDRSFIKTGLVKGYSEPNEYRSESGYFAGNDFDDGAILTNCDDKEKFDHLRGKVVRYHFRRYNGLGFPVGDLVADKLTIPMDDTLQLPPARY